jgi:putative intracellular protease/amidase
MNLNKKTRKPRLGYYRLIPVCLVIVVPLIFFLWSCVPTASPVVQFEGTLPTSPTLDLKKPTVAVVVGKDKTEITDVIAPYAAFKAASIFNVVVVAEQRVPVSLSGGLELIPHFTFTELDALLGQAPDVIIVPNIPDIDANESARLWIKQHGQNKSVVMSICAGAAMFAATGLLDGQTATTHWGDILWIEPSYPKVEWVKGVRYVDNGQYISTAGILSGLDASLRLIARLSSKEVAEQVASELHYPTQYIENSDAPQFGFGFQDALFVFAFMTSGGRDTLGVALFDGVDDMTLTALYDVYAPWLGRPRSLTPSEVITTKHGLNLVADAAPEQWDTKNKIFFPGTLEDSQQQPWLEPFQVTPTLVQNEFPFETALHYLAQNYDVATAEFAAKRLEYRWFMPR